MAKIFISYRREDTEAVANHLKSELEKYVGKGKVFLDSKGIQPGRDWRDVLQRSVKGSDCLLALIGPKWLNIGDSETKQRRLDNPDDFVRQEIRGALKNKNMPVVPVLVGDARMPEPKDLPDELKELASRQNFELRQRRWEDDVRALAEGLRLVSRSTLAKSKTGIKVAVAASLLAAALICGLLISPVDRNPDREVIALKADVNGLTTDVNDLTTKVRVLEEVVDQLRPTHHPRHITQTASHGNIRDLTGDTTTQLNRQELVSHRSDAETPDHGILGFFGSLFH
jgi:outer membrane murein-binding lipoprotein Lpp